VAVPLNLLLVVMVTCGAVVKPGPQAALLETGGRSRKGKGRSCQAFRTVPCPHARRRNPRFTLVSEGNPFPRLLVGE
jgi:hypothetical protein